MNGFRRSVIMLTALFVSVSFTLPLTAAAAPALPEANQEVRHETDCASLSEAATAYYTGAYNMDALSALHGAGDTSTSLAAMTDNPLFGALHSLMNDTQTFYPTYTGYAEGSIAYYWKRTDAAQGTKNYLSFYSDIPYYYYNGSSPYNMEREHVWPKSNASYHQTYGGADLHHLRPSVSEVNRAKSNHMFGNVRDVYSVGTEDVIFQDTVYAWVNADNDVFECKDDVKGDVARVLLYVYCRWEQPNLYSNIDAEYLPPFDPDDKTNYGYKVIESLDTLLEWIEDDPVDSWEMCRNDLTQEIQGNRNVFIDHPELAWQLFGREIPENLQAPEHAGCYHEYELTETDAANCIHNGHVTYSCKNCGTKRTRVLQMTGHSDGDANHFCDNCGERVTHSAEFTRAGQIEGAKHLLLVNKAASAAPIADDSSGKITVTTIEATGGTVSPPLDAAVFRVRQAEGGMYLMCGGKFLTSDLSGSKVYYADEPNEYSIWSLQTVDEDGNVTISCVNSAYQGGSMQQSRPAMLEVYNGTLKTYYSSNPSDLFKFTPYTFDEHICYGDTSQLYPASQIPPGSTCALCGMQIGVSNQLITPDTTPTDPLDEIPTTIPESEKKEETEPPTEETTVATEASTEKAAEMTETTTERITETSEVTTETTEAITETTTVSTEQPTKPQTYNDESLCEMAVKDYEVRTGVKPANAEPNEAADGAVSITLKDSEGNVLDKYTINRDTAAGTDSAGNAVDLPQTGINDPFDAAAAAGAAGLTIIGAFLAACVLCKKED